MKSMKLALLMVVSTCLVKVPCLQANLVVNGSFERGMSPWYTYGDAVLTSGTGKLGMYAANLIDGANDYGYIGQHVALVEGQTYRLDFWVKKSGFGLFQQFWVQLNSISPPYYQLIGSFNPTTAYTKYSFTFTPYMSHPDVSLGFVWDTGATRQGYPSAFLDAVSLTAISPPTPNVGQRRLGR